jgi:hypothetical protein
VRANSDAGIGVRELVRASWRARVGQIHPTYVRAARVSPVSLSAGAEISSLHSLYGNRSELAAPL